MNLLKQNKIFSETAMKMRLGQGGATDITPSVAKIAHQFNRMPHHKKRSGTRRPRIYA